MNSSPAILVIDLGLTNCKALVFSADGQVLGHSTVAYPTHYPGAGLVEQSPDEWLKAAQEAIDSVMSEQPSLARQIEAIGVTGHMHALVGVDKSGRSVANAIVLGDQRSVESARRITAEMGLDTIYHITGARMEESMPAAKMRWLKEHVPETFNSVHLFTGCKDYVRGWLTGDRLTDPIDACAMSVYDLESGTWSDELLNAAGITTGQLPEIQPSTALAGTLLPGVAQKLGLPAGLPVVVGGGDDIEVLGAGLMSPGNSKEHVGTTGSFLTCARELVYDPDMALEVYPHAEPGLWVIGGSITTAGAALSWAAEVLGYGDVSTAIKADDLRLGAVDHSNSLVFVPHLTGERCPSWNPKVRGAWVGLSIVHNRADLMRAAFQGTAHALHNILERIDSLIGGESQVVVSHREDESLDWLQLRANVYGRSLGVLSTPEPTALGAMILSAVGIGVYPNLHEAVATIAGVKEYVEPHVDEREWFSHQSDLYGKVREAMSPIWEVMLNGTNSIPTDEGLEATSPREGT